MASVRSALGATEAVQVAAVVTAVVGYLALSGRVPERASQVAGEPSSVLAPVMAEGNQRPAAAGRIVAGGSGDASVGPPETDRGPSGAALTLAVVAAVGATDVVAEALFATASSRAQLSIVAVLAGRHDHPVRERARATAPLGASMRSPDRHRRSGAAGRRSGLRPTPAMSPGGGLPGDPAVGRP
jgi:hypothetical protein